jgi:hypothetical protein
VGTAILALAVAIAIGEGVPNPLAQPVEVNLLSVALLTMMVGLIVAWRWEGIGGLLVLGGFGVFAAVNHGIQFNVVFGPLLATGLMYLACWWMNKSPSPPRSRSGLGSSSGVYPREERGAMRYLLVTVATIVAGFVGGILGWSAGVVMDRFRWLGLGPEEFWRTDPENVWAWGFIIGGLVGMAAFLAVSACRRRSR